MFRAGFARLDITPPLGTPMAGYYEMRYADGILDPLYINAVAWSDGHDTVLLITADILLVSLPVADLLRRMVSQRTGVAEDHIMIHALHPHTAFRVGNSESAVTDQAYLDVFYRKFADAAQMAMDDLSEAAAASAIREAIEPLSFVRRYILKDGSLKTNPQDVPKEDILRPAAEADNRVRLLRFIREGKKEITLVNFCTHPDVVSGTRISADWPGFARRFVEEDHPDVNCVMINGFQGDTNHFDYIGGRFQSQRGYAYSQKMGRVIADTVNLIWDKTEIHHAFHVSGESKIIFNKCSTRGEEYYEECRAYADRYSAGDYSTQYTESGIEKAEAYRIADMPNQPVFHKLMITALGLGDVVFLGVSGEPFTQYIHLISEMVPEKRLITVTLCNGGEGYLPSKMAFDQGGYEVISSHYTPELEETVLGTVRQMLEHF